MVTYAQLDTKPIITTDFDNILGTNGSGAIKRISADGIITGRRSFIDKAAAEAGSVSSDVTEVYVQCYSTSLNTAAGAARYRRALNDTEYTNVSAKLKMTISTFKFVIAEPVIDASMAGADPSASASVNSESIQQMILTASLLGAKCSISYPGTYSCSAAIYASSVNNTDLEIFAGVTLKGTSALVGKLLEIRGNNIHVHGFGRLDGEDIPNSLPGQANDILGMIGNDILVEDLTFWSGADYNTAGADTHIGPAGRNIVVRNTKHYGAVDIGVYVTERTATGASETNARVIGSSFFNCRACVTAKRGFIRLIVDAIHTEDCHHGVYPGEVTDGTANGTTSKNFAVTNSAFYRNTGYPINVRVSDGFQVNDNLIVDHTSGAAIIVRGSSEGQVRGNQIRIDPTVYVSPSGQRGITLDKFDHTDSITYNSLRNQVADNYVSGVYTPIFELDSNQDYNEYINNRAYGNTEGGRAGVTRQSKHSSVRSVTFDAMAADPPFNDSEWRTIPVNVRRSVSGGFNAYTTTVPEGYAVYAEVRGVINQGGGKAGGGRVHGIFRRPTGGDVQLVGSLVTQTSFSEFSAAEFYLVADTSNQSIRVRGVGEAAVDSDFALVVNIFKLKDNT